MVTKYQKMILESKKTLVKKVLQKKTKVKFSKWEETSRALDLLSHHVSIDGNNETITVTPLHLCKSQKNK